MKSLRLFRWLALLPERLSAHLPAHLPALLCARLAALSCVLLFVLPAPAMAEDNYRLVVSFSSICCGPNMGAMKKLQAQLERGGRQAGRALQVESRSRGPEGEVAMCLRLDELDGPRRDALVRRIRRSLDGERMTHVQENAACPEAMRRDGTSGKAPP